jgi:CRISPR-associated endonuclease/helicase Cas3
VVRQFNWWGAAYREAIFRLADHAQSRSEQEEKDGSPEPPGGAELPDTAVPPWTPSAERTCLCALPLPGLDGSNPLAFLAALGTLVLCHGWSQSNPDFEWLRGPVKLSWGHDGLPHTPVLHLGAKPPTPTDFIATLAERLAKSLETHPAAWVVAMLADEQRLAALLRERCAHRPAEDRPYLDWVCALACENVPKAASQLQTVRKDYLIGNLRSIMQRTKADHLLRSLFHTWDYADALDNQSLHWEPSEDRRHAYQWHMPSGDPTRKKCGGMLGANRLALEAWPLFPSFPAGDRIRTRGFKGNRANNTYFTWPLWKCALGVDAVASLLALESLLDDEPRADDLEQYNMGCVFRLQRILVGKTPNFTTAFAIR